MGPPLTLIFSLSNPKILGPPSPCAATKGAATNEAAKTFEKRILKYIEEIQ
jgi:hypothetical protein